MKSLLRKVDVPSAVGVAGLVITALYAYWATGLEPFTGLAYIAVGIPVVLLAGVAVIGGAPEPRDNGMPRAGEITLRSVLPWLVLLFVAAGLEGLGLALGGRSTTVPTLSTVIDHALAWHPVRFVLFCGWLAVGGGPVVRMYHRWVRPHSSAGG